MQKSILFLAISTILVVLGLVLLVIGNQIILEGVNQDNGLINSNQSLVISSNFTDDEEGILAIQLVEYQDNTFSIQVLDPFDTEIFFESMKEDTIEREFDITSSGTYKLIIQSNKVDETQVFGAIGPVPDAGKKSLGFISVYVLVIGLAGLAISGIFAIKKRKLV